jgi:chromosome segregation ATPase
MADTIDELMHRHHEAEQHLRAELLAQDDVVRDLQQQLQLVRKQHDEKMECIDHLNLSLADLTSQFQHEHVIGELERQLLSTKQQLAQTENELERTEAGKGKDAARVRQQQQALNLAQAQVHEAVGAVQLVQERCFRKLDCLAHELAAYQASVDDSTSSRLVTWRQCLEEEVAAKETALAKLQEMQRRLEEERAATHEAVSQHAFSSTALANLEKEVAKAQRRLDEERAANASLEKEALNKLHTDIAQLEEEVAATQRRLEEERAAKEAALRQYASSSAALDAAQQELIRLDLRLKEERAANAAREKEVHVDYM